MSVPGLTAVARARNLALILDVDRLADHASVPHGREHALVLALDALVHADVLVVLVSRDRDARAMWVHREVPRTWNLGRPEPALLGELRALIPDVRVLAICDHPRVLHALAPTDVALGIPAEGTVRGVLWWIVEQRAWRASAVM